MKRVCLFIFFLQVVLPAFSQDSPRHIRWDFEDMRGWRLHSQDDNPDSQTAVVDGMLKIYTRAGSVDRKKACTAERIYTTGRYKWRTCISETGEGDQTSIGSWIYCDDHHEIDFEVGYGKASERGKYGAKPGEMLAYMTTQDHPYSSVAVPVSPGWHIFELDLSLVDGTYYVLWIIDGKVRHSVRQTYGSEYAFLIFCSVENLSFLGDRPASRDNYGLFDWVEYTYHD